MLIISAAILSAVVPWLSCKFISDFNSINFSTTSSKPLLHASIIIGALSYPRVFTSNSKIGDIINLLDKNTKKKFITILYMKSKKKIRKSKKNQKKREQIGKGNEFEFEELESSCEENICELSCNNSNLSKKFNRIYIEFSRRLKYSETEKYEMENEIFFQLFRKLACNTKNSYNFYRDKLILYSEDYLRKTGNILEIPKQYKMLSTINNIIKFTDTEILVLIGFAELLAPFGIYFHNELLKNCNITQENIKDFVYNDIKFVVSSMDKLKWSPELNQKIIIDALNDEPYINKEPWSLKNSALCLFMPIKIHNGKSIDWHKAIEVCGCRVTRDEVCLISAHIKYRSNFYRISYIKITENWHIYIFYKKKK